MCPGRKEHKQLTQPHVPSLPLNAPVTTFSTRLSSFPLPSGSHVTADPTAHWVLVTPLMFLPPGCLSGERVIVPPHPASCAVTTQGVLWVHPQAWGMNYCLDGGCSWLEGLQQTPFSSISSRLDFVTAKSKPSTALPLPLTQCATALPTSAHPSLLEAPGCWVKLGQAAAEHGGQSREPAAPEV